MFLESGFAGARTRAISERAGVNEALLYRHFASKEELFKAAVVEPLELQIKNLLAYAPLAAAIEGHDPAREDTIREVMDTLLAAAEEVLPLLGALFYADPARGPEIWRSHLQPAWDSLTASVAGVAESWGRPDTDAHVVVMAAVGACLVAALEARMEPMSAGQRARVVQRMADNVLYGMVGERPHPG